ncbi:MAG TPA: ribosomal protein S18-alanine N-acetyltransferase [Gammaproteobacteria bacterium]
MSAAVYPRTQIRLMTPSDLKAVAQVERAAYAYPWSLGIFRDCLLAGYYSLVLDIADEVTGYGIMSIAAREAHILNLCVHPKYQRLGYGRRLLNALLLKAQDSEVDKVFLEVRPSNTAALHLYRSVGFEQIGIRPAYYQAEGGREDAVILAATLRAPR